MYAFNWTLLFEVTFIVTAMTYIGMSATWPQVTKLFGDREQVGRAFIAALLLPPLLALTLISIFTIPPEAEMALLLLSVAPGGLNMLQFSTKIGGELARAAALLFVLSILAWVSAPFGVGLIPLARQPEEVAVIASAMAFLFMVLSPTMLGVAVRHLSPELAERLARPLNFAAAVSFLGALLVGNSIKTHATAVLSGTVLLVLVLFIAGSWLIGWALSTGRSADRQQLAFATSIRNVALVLLLAITLFPNSGVDAVVFAYALLMIVPNAAMTIAELMREKRRDEVSQTP